MRKMSMRQTLMMVVSIIFSPTVRLFSAFVSGRGDQGAWVAPIVAGCGMILFVLVLDRLIRDNRNFYQHLEYSFGIFGAKALAWIYILWGILLSSVQIRYYAQRVASTIYTEIDMGVFVFIFLAICVYVLNSGIVTVARMNELFLPVILIVTVALLGLLSAKIDLRALFPVNNPLSIAHVALFNLASMGYVTFTLFFVDEIEQKEKFKKYAVWGTIGVSLCLVWLLLAVIGTIGPTVIEKLPYPFFAVVKQISIGEFLQHIEAFVITLWIVSDFVMTCFISSAILKLMGLVTKKGNTRELLIPYFALCACLVPMMGRTNFELETLSEKVFIPLNLILLFAMPIVILLVGRIKNKIKKHCAGERKMI
ncbi:MAG: endospore germination permease [Clostridia bacterium]|nr:endospore germination permease [Clostridia bacterium]